MTRRDLRAIAQAEAAAQANGESTRPPGLCTVCQGTGQVWRGPTDERYLVPCTTCKGAAAKSPHATAGDVDTSNRWPPGDVLSITLPSREAWLQERKKGIGGSDAAAALGESPWVSPYALWAEKSGLIETGKEATERMEWGNLLEPVICQRFQTVHGRRVERDPPNTIRIHREIPWMRCSLDGTQWARADEAHLPRGPGVLQVKCADAMAVAKWKKESDDGKARPPLMYDIQLQHEIDVVGYEWGSLIVLAGGNTLLGPFDTLRNDRFIESHHAILADFWERVQTLTPPQIDGSESSAKAVAKLFPQDNGLVATLSPAAELADARLQKCKARIKKLEALEAFYENTIKAEIGQNTVGLLPSGGKYTFGTVAACQMNYTRKSHRRLSRSKT